MAFKLRHAYFNQNSQIRVFFIEKLFVDFVVKGGPELVQLRKHVIINAICSPCVISC